MSRIIIFFILVLALVTQGWGQMIVKNQSTGTVLMQVTEGGKVGIALGSTAPQATLDVGGTLRIGTVNSEGNSGDISVLVWDGGVVKKRTLTADIWDGDATGLGSETDPEWSANDVDHVIGNEYQDLGNSKSGEEVTITITNGSNTSFSIQDDDHSKTNETPQAGNGISVSGRIVETDLPYEIAEAQTFNPPLESSGSSIYITGTRVTAPQDGTYLIMASSVINSQPGTNCGAFAAINGVATNIRNVFSATNTYLQSGTTASGIKQLSQGDTVDLRFRRWEGDGLCKCYGGVDNNISILYIGS